MAALGYKRALDDFVGRVTDRVGGHIDQILLYGSAARGEYRQGESDVDVLIISSSKRVYNTILDIQTDVNAEYGVALSVLFDSPNEVREEVRAGSSFMREVLSKGVLLYGNSPRGVEAFA
ncbi:MAG: nucleotidyltransferase domain-containing protein [Candidatus Altiarchaeota archaeon]